MIDATAKLDDLREEFLATSTQSMPIAGIIYWGIVAVVALYVTPVQLGYIVGFGSGMVFPFGILLDLLRGKKSPRANNENPVTQMFLQSLVLVVLLWPLVLIGAFLAHNATLVVLALLMGVIWIPYGWAANDPVGLQHAIGRSVLSYACFLLCQRLTRRRPSPLRCYFVTPIACSACESRWWVVEVFSPGKEPQIPSGNDNKRAELPRRAYFDQEPR